MISLWFEMFYLLKHSVSREVREWNIRGPRDAIWLLLKSSVLRDVNDLKRFPSKDVIRL